MKKIKLFCFCLLACLALSSYATEAFRLHRYDAFKALKVTENDVVFFGNSITDMHNWTEAFTGSPYRIVNRGNSGGLSFELLSNIQSVVSGKPAKIFMKIGTNDLGSGYSPQSICDNIQKIVDIVKEQSPNTEFYIQGVLPAKDQSNKTLTTIKQTNTLLKAIADADPDDKVFFVNLYDDLLGIRDGGDFSADNLHLKAYGYKIWCDKVAPLIDAGCTCVYPENTASIQSMGGLSGSHGMRVTYYSCQKIEADDILFVGDEMVKCGEWNELFGTEKVKNRGTGWGYGGDISTISTSINTIMTGISGSEAPKAVFLYTGTADLNGSTALNTVLTNYKAIVTKIHAKAPNAKIYLIGNLPTFNASTNTNRIKTFNNNLKTYAESNSTYLNYVDTYTPFLDGTTANTKYITAGDGGAYLYGVGYGKMAEILQPIVDELTGTTNTGIGELEAARNVAVTSASGIVNSVKGGTALGEYPEAYVSVMKQALEQLKSATTTEDIENLTTALENANNNLTQNLNLPTETNTSGKQFSICSASRGSRYLFTDGTTLNGNATNLNTKKFRWIFEYRSDGTVDIKNSANDTYISPSASYNTTIQVSKTKPTNGWTLSYCNTAGLYIISNGTVELNMTNNSGYPVYNWSSGQTGTDRSDAGCQWLIEDVTDVPVVTPVAGVPEFQATSPATLTSGWHQVKWVNNADDTKTGVMSDVDGKYVFNYETNKTVSGADYPLYLSDVKTLTSADEAAKTFIYLDRGTASATAVASLRSSNGSYVNISGQAGSSSSLYVIYFSSASYPTNSVVCSGTSGTTRTSWVPMETGGVRYIGGGSANKYPMCQFSPVSLTAVNMKAVNVTVKGMGDVQVTCKSEKAYGYKTVYSGGAFFVDAETELTADDFEAPEKTGYTKVITLSGDNLTVTYKSGEEQATAETFEVFPTLTTSDIPYRIPAIATAGKSGAVIAIADYRTSRSDIGSGEIDLHIRRTTDNGQTWDEILKPSQMDGDGKLTAGYQKGAYGDPCIVGDRESDKVLVMSCSGHPGFFAGSRTQHQGWARWYSEDGGLTWTEPEFVDEQFIYAPLEKGGYGSCTGWFSGSGRIYQSHYVKKGDYYRLYVAGSTYNGSSTANWVLYSDDFGLNWEFLGDAKNSPIPGGDEPKVEELPGGNIVISSRCTQGRNYNIFTFSDREKAEGSWSTKALSSSANNGVTANNGCNGEIMILPVVRKSDNTKHFLALQSLPRGSGRTNVSIFYKLLDSTDKYDTPENFAKNWDGYLTVSSIGSAYSTMTWQNNNTIGFLYEEETHCGTGGGGYTIVYKNYTLEDITNGLYTFEKNHDYQTDKAPLAVVSVNPTEGFVKSLESVTLTYSQALSEVLTPSVTLATDVTATAALNGNTLTLTLDNAITETGAYTLTVPAGVVKTADDAQNSALTLNYTIFDDTKTYLLYNDHFTTYAIYKDGQTNIWAAGMKGDSGHSLVSDNSSCATAVDKTSANSAWMFVTVNGLQYLYNVGADKFITTGTPCTFTSTVTPVSSVSLSDGAFAFNTTGDGQKYMCAAPQLAGKPISSWTSDDAGSSWVFQPCSVEGDYEALIQKIDPTTGVNSVTTTVSKAVYDLQGRKMQALPTRRGIYIRDGKKVLK